jgi:lipoteichoic acid synthase
MNADSARPPRPGRWRQSGHWLRQRALLAQLTAASGSAWSLGAGFALALLLMTWLGRTVMLGSALASGLLHGLSAWHVLWLVPELAHDGVVACATMLVLGGLLRVLPRRLRWLALALGYLWVVLGSLIVIVSIPIYRALQTTLQLTQLLLAGGVHDLFDAGLGIVPPIVFVLALLLLVADCLAVPLLAALAQRLVSDRRRVRWLLALALTLAVAAVVSERVAPEEGAQLLQHSAVYEFASSLGHFYLRRRLDPVDMKDAPHFDASLMFGTPPRAVPTEKLVNVTKLPLHRPNVVMVVLESASVRETGLWSGRPQDTPRLTEMSKQGLVFDEYYSPSPVSMKSLFTMGCSSYPHTTPQAETYTNPSIDCLTISELLKDAGYRTGLFHGGHFSYTRKDAFFRHRRYDVMRDAKTLLHNGSYKKVLWGADDRAVIDDSLQWLEQGNPQTPFFLHVIFLAPHEPYIVHDTPEPFGTETATERYRNATLFIDGQVGRIWDWLHAHDKADNTLVVVVGDHGESFGEHRGDFMHGGRIYETAVHTPLMLVNSQLFNGQRSDRTGNHLDLLPTVLDLIGVPNAPRHQGQSLLRGYQPHMLYFYADWQRHYLGLRDGQWKYIYNVDRERHELYDLAHDSAEEHNLALRYPNQIDAYAKRTLNFEQFYRELIPNYERYVDGPDACSGKPECYLDELKPVVQHGIMRKNLSGSGFRLQLGTRYYDHGMGVAPLSIVRFNIRGDGFHRFKGGVGHHAQGGHANLSLKVSTEIYLDDQLLWSSGKLTADEPAKEFDLDVSDGALLELIGYDVDAEDWRDYIDWVDLRLQR